MVNIIYICAMNIHFTDIELFERLKESSLFRIEVGSKMYGLNTEKSDIDYLYIYPTSENELNSFLNNQHQLQFKENNIDHNFTSLHTFLSNLIKGDSTINFEVINSTELLNTCLDFLYINRNDFYNYSIIRSYLGLARRDYKFFFKENDDYEQTKKLIHIIRGVMFAENIINSNFNLLYDKLLVIANYIRTVNNIKRTELAHDYSKKCGDIRNRLNDTLNKKEIVKYLSIDSQKRLDSELFKLIKSEFYINKKNLLNDFDMSRFYNSFENWVEY